MLGLLLVYNNNYINMVLLSIFLSSFSQWYDRRQTVDDRAPSCNKITHDLWINFCDGVQPTIWESFITYCKFIVWIGRQAPSLQLVVLLLLAITRFYKHSDYEQHCPFNGTQSTRSAMQVSPAAIRIYCPKTDSEL